MNRTEQYKKFVAKYGKRPVDIVCAVSYEEGKADGRREVVEFIEKRRDACQLNTEQIDCRLCLSKLLKTLSGKSSSTPSLMALVLSEAEGLEK